MCPRRGNVNSALATNKNKREEHETRRQEKKGREKKTYLKNDENARAFRDQLRTFNLQLRDIIGDGNCLFRSFADQMDGDQQRHTEYRAKICDFMRRNRVDFEPFIVDEPFDTFMSALAKDGTYGGNECLVAFSRLYDVQICIHQLNQPVWTVCFSNSPKHDIHISYHNFEHYSSVRRLGDDTSASANIRQPMTTCDVTIAKEKNNNNTTTENLNGACAAPPPLFDEHDIAYIQSQLTNTVDHNLIRETLVDNGGDIDGTIAYLLAVDLPPSPNQSQERSPFLEKIMSITGIHDVDLVEQSFMVNNCDIDLTVEALLELTTTDHENSKVMIDADDEEEEEEEKQQKQQQQETADESQQSTVTNKTPATAKKPLPNRQVKIDKKKAKKERATAKRRAEMLASAGKVKQPEEQPIQPEIDQEQQPPANMEFIRI